MTRKRGLGKRGILKEAQQTVEEMEDTVLTRNAASGTPRMKERRQTSSVRSDGSDEQEQRPLNGDGKPDAGKTPDE